MTSSSVIMNLDSTTNSSSPESSRKKRKRKNLNSSSSSSSLYNQKQLIQTNKWKSESKQRIYSTKLLEALHRVRNTSSSSCSSSYSSPSSSSLPRGSRAVREAADRALAFEAKGKTRWSRAILTGRIKLKLKKINKPRLINVNENSKKKPVKVNTKVPVLQKKVRVLGRLVPGCRKVSFPDLLEEATDYIAAMEMQVKAMTALAELLSGLGSTTSTSSSSSSSATTTTTNNNDNQVYHQHPTISLAGSESFDVIPGVVLGNPPPL
ncbi:hypothetical protein MKX01_041582 [Papaver californicum]|nr:hypothetical protein MKX01_041582 [Papaver californicum]